MPPTGKWKATTIAWVVGTCSLIAFIAYSSQIMVIYPWYGGLSWELVKLLLPFNLLVMMIWWNYYLVVTTPPGSVPQGWRPSANATLEVKTSSHAPRYCKTCDHFKPPRAHHCRTCDSCVLKLDHHCPWVANCVGYHNHGHFIRFLIWVDIATSFHLLMMVSKALSISNDPWEEPTLSGILFIVFNFAACIPVWLCVGMFTIYHLYLIGTNTTTIERWEKDKVATLVRRGKIQEIKYPYNVGWKANMRAVLGPHWYTWLWPQPVKGDGLSYPVNPDAGGESATAWAYAVTQEQGMGQGYRATATGHPLSDPSGLGSGSGSGSGSASGSLAPLQARLRSHLQPSDASHMV